MSQSSDASPDRELMPINRYEWERLVRRIAMPSTTKLVALTLASYANRDGTQVRPGRARMSAVVGMTTRTISRHFVKLREMGLVDRVSKGSGSGFHSHADMYRLTIPTDLQDSSEMLGPDERASDIHVTDSDTEQVTPTSPSKAALSDTRRPEQVTSGTEQVTLGAGVGDTSVTPPTQTSQRPTQDQASVQHTVTVRAEAREPDPWELESAEKCTDCNGGFRGSDDEGRPIPCTKCRPHLARVIPLYDRKAG